MTIFDVIHMARKARKDVGRGNKWHIRAQRRMRRSYPSKE
jgi:hypothetical protein